MIQNPLESLMRKLSILPGLGPRSARRLALHLMTNRETALNPLMRVLEESARHLCTCQICGNLDRHDPCSICLDQTRTQEILCVVSGVADLWAIERTQIYKGQYHVLGGLLSMLDGIGPEHLSVDSLCARLNQGGIREVILALSATASGQSTMHYVMDRLSDIPNIQITRLAHGMPVGGDLDYLDDGTIATALRARSNVA